LHLLSHGIRPVFYESEFAQYWQDAMFENLKLASFNPDIIFIHTTNLNIIRFPYASNNANECETYLQEEYERFRSMWENCQTVTTAQ
jgi:hypothetical protein